jgi:hypothetical protein
VPSTGLGPRSVQQIRIPSELNGEVRVIIRERRVQTPPLSIARRAPASSAMWGAATVPQLGRRLSAAHARGSSEQRKREAVIVRQKRPVGGLGAERQRRGDCWARPS